MYYINIGWIRNTGACVLLSGSRPS